MAQSHLNIQNYTIKKAQMFFPLITFLQLNTYNMSSYVQVYVMVFLVCTNYMCPQVTKNNIEALVSQYKKATAGFTSRTAPEKVCMYFNVMCGASSYHMCMYGYKCGRGDAYNGKSHLIYHCILYPLHQ